MSKKTDKDADTGSILGNIILEEVVEAIEEARSPTPDIFPPIPHEAPQPKGTPAVNKREDEQESPRKRPDAPGHHSR
ncbi:hypothetical protein [Nitrospirillum viridazoti]|uniref:Uncharacterized protein n=1 Tax=Nitrospirillum viridazoti CBAmc TaxID=1441467 RepID=A0A248JVR2_9PROT|nr:hypothetical protein [Nitrospirillum amazonense]ASG22807.1 hypothetical protein Y958_18070 [Nitrospirillum amazonense CBAmc]TWB33734.1 hypothetical protein FBZ91_11385 [Nitrospirillum amazonense]